MTNEIIINTEKKEFDHLKMMAKVAADSKNYANMTESQLFNLMLSAKDLGISPMKAINGGFYLVNGKVCMSTALMTDRIRKAGHSIKITEMTRDKCTIIAIRRDNEDSLKLEYTMEDASLAGLVNSPTWKKYPKNMLYNRCMSQVARILFPDVVGNCYSEEERFDIQNVPPEKRPLENAEPELIVDAPMIAPQVLSEDEIWKIDSLLIEINDDKVVKKIFSILEISSVSEIKPQDFERTMKYLKNVLKAKKESENNEQSA